jgi:hypothetical protein
VLWEPRLDGYNRLGNADVVYPPDCVGEGAADAEEAWVGGGPT